ncbi:MAG: SRPBCC family protein [Anaerolineales bacterium]
MSTAIPDFVSLARMPRPQEEVFNYVMDLANDPEWQSGIMSNERTSAGPVGAGNTWHYKVKSLGRTMEVDIQITGYDPPNRASVKAIGGPVPFENTYTFESKDAGAQLTLTGQAELGGIFKLAEGLVSKQFEKQFDADISRLKIILEAG